MAANRKIVVECINPVTKVVDGIQHLEPYWSLYQSNVKGRWVGREMLDVISTEFLSLNRNYPKVAILLGRIFVNGKPVMDPRYRLKQKDFLTHLTHRHEHPILAVPIQIIVDTKKYLVVNKPPSMPVHACGQYSFHSVISILKTVHGFKDLKIGHRLDRTTSGVLILPRDAESDRQFKQLIESGGITKEYVCKVEGLFPEDEQVCDVPLGLLSPSMGIQCVRRDGKKCLSKFKRLFVNETEGTSVVHCIIATGRTHQIRIHLQYLGFPILDDNLYNSYVWGPTKGKMAEYGKPIEQLRLDVQDAHRASLWIEKETTDYSAKLAEMADDEKLIAEENDLYNLELDKRPSYDPICLGCNVEKRIPDMSHFRTHLHCWRYKSESFEFEAPLPDWAKEDLEAKAPKMQRVG